MASMVVRQGAVAGGVIALGLLLVAGAITIPSAAGSASLAWAISLVGAFHPSFHSSRNSVTMSGSIRVCLSVSLPLCPHQRTRQRMRR